MQYTFLLLVLNVLCFHQKVFLDPKELMQRAKEEIVKCDALLIDDKSISNTFPFMKIDTNKVDIAHEASVGKIGDDEIFYLMSRGLTEGQAKNVMIKGFFEHILNRMDPNIRMNLSEMKISRWWLQIQKRFTQIGQNNSIKLQKIRVLKCF